MISERFPSPTQLTLFPEASPVNLSQSQENKKEKTTTVISGQNLLNKYEPLGRPMLFAKMFLASSSWLSKRCVLTWKLKAIQSKRLLFQLAVSVRSTSEIGSGLLPTPTKDSVSMRKSKYKQGGIPLTTYLQQSLLPTPTAVSRVRSEETLAKCQAFRKKNANQNTVPLYLEETVLRMFPTPKANDYRSGMENRFNTHHTQQLNDTMAYLHSKTSRLNPPFVEQMLGYPIGWSELSPSETVLYLKSRTKSLKQ